MSNAFHRNAVDQHLRALSLRPLADDGDVTRVELMADTNSTWKAVIHCIAKEVDVTDMDSKDVEFVSTHKHHSIPQSDDAH